MLATLRRPLLVVAGADDFVPTAAARAWAAPTAAAVVIVPGAGHYVHLERPDAVQAAIERFLAAQSR
jgi:pimeloyl-ACP methyl ester carboxylesterase